MKIGSQDHPSASAILSPRPFFCLQGALYLNRILLGVNHPSLVEEIEVSNKFKEWQDSLTREECGSAHLEMGAPAEIMPGPGRHKVEALRGLRLANRKKLLDQHQSRANRILFAFDLRHRVYLIHGGGKTI
jgi:hypothetical protein